MRLSQCLYKSKKDINDNLPKSINRLLRGCFLIQEASGIYTMLPLGLKVIRKITKIIEDEMNKIAIQVELPFLQSTELWKKSGRYDVYGKEMLRIYDRNNQEYILPPTCEEGIFNLLVSTSTSYRMLPTVIYQITWKFRDEMRPRSGLLRGRLFLMKDAYSFAINEDQALEHYRIHYNTYCNIFKKMSMKVYVIKADSGEIGGDLSHEFVIKSEEGDSIAYLNKTAYEINTIEEINLQMGTFDEKFKKNDIQYEETKVIELGHIFYYDTKYSEKLNAQYINSDNKMVYYYGGCYGIGVSRIMGLLSMEKFWPSSVSPFEIHLITINNQEDKGNEIYKKLLENNIDVLYDDRAKISYGEKIQDMELIGIPLRIIIGSNSIELYDKDEEKQDFYNFDTLLISIKNKIVL